MRPAGPGGCRPRAADRRRPAWRRPNRGSLAGHRGAHGRCGQAGRARPVHGGSRGRWHARGGSRRHAGTGRRGQPAPAPAGRGGLPARRGPRAGGGRHRRRRAARAVPRGAPPVARRAGRHASVAGPHRWECRRRRDRRDPRCAVRQPRGRPHRRTRQLAAGGARARRPRDRVWRAVGGSRAATTARSCSCGRPATRRRCVAAARIGWRSPRPPRSPTCRGTWRSPRSSDSGPPLAWPWVRSTISSPPSIRRAVSSRAAALGRVEGPRPHPSAERDEPT